MEQSLSDKEIEIFQKIVDIVTNQDFQKSQFEFFEKHAKTFDVDDENKLEYTNIFQEYCHCFDEIIDAKLKEHFEQDQVDDFYKGFKANQELYKA